MTATNKIFSGILSVFMHHLRELHRVKTRNVHINFLFVYKKQCKNIGKRKDTAHYFIMQTKMCHARMKYLIQAINTLNSVHCLINHPKISYGIWKRWTWACAYCKWLAYTQTRRFVILVMFHHSKYFRKCVYVRHTLYAYFRKCILDRVITRTGSSRFVADF